MASGAITFVFTDIEGSTRLWEQQPEAMNAALQRHDQMLRACLESKGRVFKTVGDAFCAAFASPRDAVAAAIEAQRALGETGLLVRMAIHTGEAQERDADYFGPTLNRVARLLSVGHGGQVLFSRATYELVCDRMPHEAAARFLGEHRLRDLERPEGVYQLLHETLPDVFPPLRSLRSLPNNLPLQVTSFIGRERELEDVASLVREHRLVTLTGAGGTGKTRLSVQAGADLLSDFEDGVWFVELAALTEGGLVAHAIAASLRIREEPGRPLDKTLLASLENKQLLLILDNCEHLLDATAQIVGSILSFCRHTRVMTSGREPLGIPGEMVYRVPSLSTPDPKESLTAASLAQFEAVRLFVDRALLAQQSFAVVDANAPAIAKICFRLDGIPLAIELAAARVRAMPVETIAERLDDRFHLLTGGSRTALPRQQTLRAAIDWSYDLLGEMERQLLHRLSVFAGGWTLGSAERVCSDSDGEKPIHEADVLDLLTRLVEQSLVLYDPTMDRYRLFESVKQYAAGLLTGEIERATRTRHFREFESIACAAESGLQGEEQEDWLRRLELEHDNVGAALAWCTAADAPADLLEPGMVAAASLWRYWDISGRYELGLTGLRSLLSHSPSKSRSHAMALEATGRLAYYRGDFKEAKRMFGEAVQMFRDLGEVVAASHALHGLAMAEGNCGERDGVREKLEECLHVFRQVNDLPGIARALNGLGFQALGLGDHERAEPLILEALDIRKRLHDVQGEQIASFYIAVCEARRGDFECSKQRLEDCIATDRRLGYSRGLAISLTHTAAMELVMDRPEEARSNLAEATRTALELRDPALITATLPVWAWLARLTGDTELESTLTVAYEVHKDLMGLFPAAIADPNRTHAPPADLASAKAAAPEKAAAEALSRLGKLPP